MPTYDYVCTECEHALEAFHSMSADPLKDCPSCGQPALKRLIGTGAGLIFKGSGFYATDYRSAGYQKSAKAEKEGGKPSSESSKSDSSSSTPSPKA